MSDRRPYATPPLADPGRRIFCRAEGALHTVLALLSGRPLGAVSARSLVLGVALAACAASAQDPGGPTPLPVVIADGDLRECDGSDTPTFVACVRDVLAAEDAELNRVYAAAIDSVRSAGEDSRTEAHEASLREAQRRWVAFKEQDCGDTVAVPERWGARWAVTLGDVSRVTKTRVRTAELRLHYLTTQ